MTALPTKGFFFKARVRARRLSDSSLHRASTTNQPTNYPAGKRNNNNNQYRLQLLAGKPSAAATQHLNWSTIHKPTNHESNRKRMSQPSNEPNRAWSNVCVQCQTTFGSSEIFPHLIQKASWLTFGSREGRRQPNFKWLKD